MQHFANEAKGENVLIVTHMDAVNASVSRYKPWALVYPVKHTGFTVSYREQYEGVHPSRCLLCCMSLFKQFKSFESQKVNFSALFGLPSRGIEASCQDQHVLW